MKKEKIILRISALVAIQMSVSTGMHVIGGIIEGNHGAPAFLSGWFMVYGILSSLLLVGGYLFMGYRIPVKNRVIRGVTYIFLFWVSDYLSQIIGILGAESSILNSEAISATTILFDTIGYFVTGIFLGLLLDIKANLPARKCSGKSLALACIVSAAVFAGVVFGLDMFCGSIDHSLFGYAAFGISEEKKVQYYSVFYLCQAFSGLLFPIIYRFTEYNSEHSRKWLYFASVYGLMLWAPVVIIVIFFGIPVLPTLIFTIILVAAIYVDSVVFTYILQREFELT